MTTTSPVPRRLRTPSWFDLRLVVGVVLVLGSVAAGAVVVSRADATRPMLVAVHDLAAGTVLRETDLTTRNVRLTGSARAYLPRGSAVSGQTLGVPVHAGELVARSMIGSTQAATTVTVPVKPEDAPSVVRGQRVTVWVHTQYCAGVTVLGDVAVQDVRLAGTGALASASSESIVVRVPRALAQRLVGALDLPQVSVRVGTLSGAADPAANQNLPQLSGCRQPAPRAS